MKKALMIAALAAGLAFPAAAQVQENLDLGNVFSPTTTFAAGVYSAQPAPVSQDRGLQCQYTQTAAAGEPWTVVVLQSLDAGSSVWNTLLATPANFGGFTQTLVIYPGIVPASLPSGFYGLNAHLPRVWRAQLYVNGNNTPSVTATLGCNLLN